MRTSGQLNAIGASPLFRGLTLAVPLLGLVGPPASSARQTRYTLRTGWQGESAFREVKLAHSTTRIDLHALVYQRAAGSAGASQGRRDRARIAWAAREVAGGRLVLGNQRHLIPSSGRGFHSAFRARGGWLTPAPSYTAAASGVSWSGVRRFAWALAAGTDRAGVRVASITLGRGPWKLARVFVPGGSGWKATWARSRGRSPWRVEAEWSEEGRALRAALAGGTKEAAGASVVWERRSGAAARWFALAGLRLRSGTWSGTGVEWLLERDPGRELPVRTASSATFQARRGRWIFRSECRFRRPSNERWQWSVIENDRRRVDYEIRARARALSLPRELVVIARRRRGAFRAELRVELPESSPRRGSLRFAHDMGSSSASVRLDWNPQRKPRVELAWQARPHWELALHNERSPPQNPEGRSPSPALGE